MKRTLARAISFTVFVISLALAPQPVQAALSVEAPCAETFCIITVPDNTNPRLGDTVNFRTQYSVSARQTCSELGGNVSGGVALNPTNVLASHLQLSASYDASSVVASLTFSAVGIYKFSFAGWCHASQWVPIFSDVFVVEIESPKPLPAKPTAVEVTPSDSSVVVRWAKAENALSYVAHASPAGKQCVTVTETTCTITGLVNGTSQTISVTAGNGFPQDSMTSESSPAVTIGTPLQVSGSISSPNWRVGETVTLRPLLVGNPSHTDIQWFRCASSLAASSAQPNCEMLPGQNSNSYVLTAADLGKFISGFIHVTNAWSDAQFATGSSPAVVSVNAPAPQPVRDPDGKPAVTAIPVRDIPVTGGTTLTINGTNLEAVSSVSINGVKATIISSTPTTLVVQVPPTADRAGLVDLVVENQKGSFSSSLALNYVAGSPVVYAAKKLSLNWPSATSKTLSTSQKLKIKSFTKLADGYINLTCIGDVTGIKFSSSQKAMALARAKAVCTYAKSLNPAIMTLPSGAQSEVSGKISRTVKLTFTR